MAHAIICAFYINFNTMETTILHNLPEKHQKIARFLMTNKNKYRVRYLHYRFGRWLSLRNFQLILSQIRSAGISIVWSVDGIRYTDDMQEIRQYIKKLEIRARKTIVTEYNIIKALSKKANIKYSLFNLLKDVDRTKSIKC